MPISYYLRKLSPAVWPLFSVSWEIHTRQPFTDTTIGLANDTGTLVTRSPLRWSREADRRRDQLLRYDAAHGNVVTMIRWARWTWVNTTSR